ncbi:glycosyltransferase family 2 protein [Galbitalea sp. SE-J8]|uniref:glycosyltransferase family 2 protein n=1 Tax=Galbitalea sp. SE-J8 TaxID=3054952 RepID=UPI00259CE50A|nr:glycosyltransferase family 2 protein [Galbitalea sp. SE-J8]MDM4763542.1 glycosyltransferase family 2 protein [Galbitalea sp. SE-J8]
MRARPRVGVVVLTQGTRPDDLARGLASVAAQREVDTDVVVVGNGWSPAGVPASVRTLALPENVGIPAGRNRGAEALAAGDHGWLLFLDDDASLAGETFLADAIALVERDPRIGLVQPRVVDPALAAGPGAASPRRWVPRIRKGDPAASGAVFSVWEGAVVLPRAVFERAGGWGEPYWYAHEGIELAWRVWAAGGIAWYAGGLVAHHPAISPTRHAEYYRLNARNRVWLAKRNLPWPLVPVYVASWTGVQLVRGIRSRGAGLGPWFAGWLEGWRRDPGGRRSIGWVTVRRMTAAGRPPLI